MTQATQNKLTGRVKGPKLGFLFKPKTIISLVLIGIFSFAALIALSGYAEDLRKDVNGKATANSRSAVGYAGYVQLLKGMEYEVSLPGNLLTTESSWDTPALRIYTLVNAYQSETLKEIPNDEAQLIILPKWVTSRQVGKTGWVEKPIKDPTFSYIRLSTMLENADIDLRIDQAEKDENNTEYALKFGALDNVDGDEDPEYEPPNYDIYTIESAVERLQYFDISDTVEAPDVILTADTRPILVRLSGTQTYILSEPDLLNTHGITTQSRARLAVNILDVIAEYEGLAPNAADFDLSIHGLGGGRNIIKLLTQPPFLAATLCLLAAGGIIAWQAFSRFGDPQRNEPDFAQGPVSLAKSAAEFMSVSGRVQHMAPDYAQLTRQQVIRKMGLVGQSQDNIDRWIKTRETQRDITPSFEQLNAAKGQDKTTNLIEHARAMTRWKEEMMS